MSWTKMLTNTTSPSIWCGPAFPFYEILKNVLVTLEMTQNVSFLELHHPTSKIVTTVLGGGI